MATKRDDSLKGPFVLIQEAWNVYKRNAGTYISLILLSIAFSFVGVLVGLLAGVVTFTATQDIVSAALVGVLIGIPVLMYLTYWVQASLLKATVADSEGEKTSVAEAFNGSKSLILPLFVLGLISGFITLGGFALLVIPGIILTVWFSMSTYILFKEGKKGFEALLTSREYVRGMAGTVFIYLFIFAVLGYALQSIPTFFFNQADAEFAGSLFSMIISFIVGPLGMLYSVGIYKELRRIKGEVSVTVTSLDKAKYLAVGAIGTFLFLFVLVNLVSVFASLFQSGLWDVENNNIEMQMESPTDEYEFTPETV